MMQKSLQLYQIILVQVLARHLHLGAEWDCDGIVGGR